MPRSLSWTDVREIGEALAEQYPGIDPAAVRFTELRGMVQRLAEFRTAAGQQPNEQILEAIQQAWCDEVQDRRDDEDDEGYRSPVAFKPE